MQQAGITSAEARRLSFGPDPDVDEWHFDGHPTCVARGVDWAKCDSEVNALLCPGASISDGLLSTATYGTGEAQAEAVKEAIRSLGFVHPDCPGCVNPRTLDHSPTVCRTLKGQVCPFTCESGFEVNGTHTCNENGSLTGGRCSVIKHNPDVSIEPTPTPTWVSPWKPMTPVVVDHVNWTAYADNLAYTQTPEYKERLSGDTCLYLRQLSEYYYWLGRWKPREPIRMGLFTAARAAKCKWIHDPVLANNAEHPHIVPERGDRGPWPRVYNAIRVMVEGYGPVAVSIDRKVSKGIDLYTALKTAMSTKNEFTIHVPGTSRPLDDGDDLSTLGLETGTVLRADKGKKSLRARESKDGHKRPAESKHESWTLPDTETGAIAG